MRKNYLSLKGNKFVLFVFSNSSRGNTVLWEDKSCLGEGALPCPHSSTKASEEFSVEVIVVVA